jgi:adenosylcobinamide-GDP ribazoletransferase
VSGLRLALGFLTALPIRPRGRLAPGDLGRAAAWFPLVGLAIGVVLWGVRTLLEGHLPALVVGAVAVGMWAAASGALHLDGLADCMDGMMASVPPDRRLVIMADVRVGAFAAAGLCLFLITKIAAAAGLSSSGPLLLAPTLGRWWLLPLARMRSAHPGGLGDQLHAAAPPPCCGAGWPERASAARQETCWGRPASGPSWPHCCRFCGGEAVVALSAGDHFLHCA